MTTPVWMHSKTYGKSSATTSNRQRQTSQPRSRALSSSPSKRGLLTGSLDQVRSAGSDPSTSAAATTQPPRQRLHRRRPARQHDLPPGEGEDSAPDYLAGLAGSYSGRSPHRQHRTHGGGGGVGGGSESRAGGGQSSETCGEGGSGYGQDSGTTEKRS